MTEKSGTHVTPKILFEDEWLIIVSKPGGLMVHANPDQTPPVPPNLQDVLSVGRKRRLVLFHRLDKDTSGIVILGKRPEIGEAMSKLFEEKRIRKAYYAIVSGRWENKVNRVESFLARGGEGRMVETTSDLGKRALTTFRVKEAQSDKTWIEAMPKTGRTHQIRVHCASVGHPILGDKLYGTPAEAGLALHAHQVNFAHPVTGEKLQIFDPPPKTWESWLTGFTRADSSLSRSALGGLQ